MDTIVDWGTTILGGLLIFGLASAPRLLMIESFEGDRARKRRKAHEVRENRLLYCPHHFP